MATTSLISDDCHATCGPYLAGSLSKAKDRLKRRIYQQYQKLDPEPISFIGSRCADVRAVFSGLAGRPLRPGDRLAIKPLETTC